MRKIQLSRTRADADPSKFPGNLTARELAAVDSMSRHGRKKVAADELCISYSTLCDHLKSAYIKAGVHSAVTLVALYVAATQPAQQGVAA